MSKDPRAVALRWSPPSSSNALMGFPPPQPSDDQQAFQNEAAAAIRILRKHYVQYFDKCVGELLAKHPDESTPERSAHPIFRYRRHASFMMTNARLKSTMREVSNSVHAIHREVEDLLKNRLQKSLSGEASSDSNSSHSDASSDSSVLSQRLTRNVNDIETQQSYQKGLDSENNGYEKGKLSTRILLENGVALPAGARVAICDIGGAVGTQLLSLRKELRALGVNCNHVLLFEFMEAATQRAETLFRDEKKRDEEKKRDAFTWHTETGDVTSHLDAGCQVLDKWRESGVDTVLVTFHAVLHELPTRSPDFNMKNLISKLIAGFSNWCVLAREPTYPGSDEQRKQYSLAESSDQTASRTAALTDAERQENEKNGNYNNGLVAAPLCVSASGFFEASHFVAVAEVLVETHPSHFKGEQPVVAENGLARMRGDLALETVFKLLHGHGIEEFDYELDEILTSFDPNHFLSCFPSTSLHSSTRFYKASSFHKSCIKRYNILFSSPDAAAGSSFFADPLCHVEVLCCSSTCVDQQRAAEMLKQFESGGVEMRPESARSGADVNGAFDVLSQAGVPSELLAKCRATLEDK